MSIVSIGVLAKFVELAEALISFWRKITKGKETPKEEVAPLSKSAEQTLKILDHLAKAPEKIFLLATDVLVHNPEAFLSFDDNIIIVTNRTLKDLERLEKDGKHVSLAERAKDALKKISEYAENKNAPHGMILPNLGTFYLLNDELVGVTGKHDKEVVAIAIALRRKSVKVTIVSKSTVTRSIANTYGFDAEDYLTDKASLFKNHGKLIGVGESVGEIGSVRYQKANEGIYKIIGKEGYSSLIKQHKEIYGLAPKNDEQECLINALLDPKITLIAVTGPAGTGKTLLALAAALHQTDKSDPLYDQVIVARPVVPMKNQEIGFLPGGTEEKLSPWLRPIYDNLDVIFNKVEKTTKAYTRYGNHRDECENIAREMFLDKGKLKVESLDKIRGATLAKRYFIVDEAQNLTPHEVKTIVTRCGEGTKIVLTADVGQIDALYLDEESNGVSYLVERFINEPEFCYLNLVSAVRSALAEKAGKLL